MIFTMQHLILLCHNAGDQRIVSYNGVNLSTTIALVFNPVTGSLRNPALNLFSHKLIYMCPKRQYKNIPLGVCNF